MSQQTRENEIHGKTSRIGLLLGNKVFESFGTLDCSDDSSVYIHPLESGIECKIDEHLLGFLPSRDIF